MMVTCAVRSLAVLAGLSFVGQVASVALDWSHEAAHYNASLEQALSQVPGTYSDDGPVKAVAPTEPFYCYERRTNCKYWDVNPAMALNRAKLFCKTLENIHGFEGPAWRGIKDMWYNFFAPNRYSWLITWKPGCHNLGETDSLSVYMPITEPKNFTCLDAFLVAWYGCNNGGRGGRVAVGW